MIPLGKEVIADSCGIAELLLHFKPCTLADMLGPPHAGSASEAIRCSLPPCVEVSVLSDDRPHSCIPLWACISQEGCGRIAHCHLSHPPVITAYSVLARMFPQEWCMAGLHPLGAFRPGIMRTCLPHQCPCVCYVFVSHCLLRLFPLQAWGCGLVLLKGHGHTV